MPSLVKALVLIFAASLLAPAPVFAQGQAPAPTNDYLLPDPPADEPEKPSLSLYDALVTPDTSPRGTNASAVEADKLVEEARAFLTGADGHPRDPKEGAYWLKRALLATPDAAGKQRAWAITTLAVTYAKGDDLKTGVPVARQLWEIAAAMGDPSALCNLGLLTETGDGGVKVDKKKAIAWYEKAKAAGCGRANDALIRLNR
jgi:hypothetical protein